MEAVNVQDEVIVKGVVPVKKAALLELSVVPLEFDVSL
jgi:hypothetical protein